MTTQRKKHIFLTGDIQVGKSTAINRALAGADVHPSGFRTVAGPVLTDGSDSIHIVSAVGNEPLNADNMVFRRRIPTSNGAFRFEVYPAVFDRQGCKLITASKTAPLLMDEIGIREAGCKAFRNAILTALDGSIPILGVVQIRKGGFLDEIRQHPSVRLITVTIENRNAVAAELAEWLQKNCR